MTTTRRRRRVMLGIRLTADTRTAFRLWCMQRDQTMNDVLEADVRRHLLTPAVGPIPRDRALVRQGRTFWRRLTSWGRRQR